MGRWLVVFLLLLVQIQFVWGAAAVYCGHEAGATNVQQHFGHHEHRHQGDDPKARGVDVAANGVGALHADCESCHLGTSGTLPAAILALKTPPQCDYNPDCGRHFSSHFPSAPERPDRSLLAAVA